MLEHEYGEKESKESLLNLARRMLAVLDHARPRGKRSTVSIGVRGPARDRS
jgi:hypothetical protein